MKEIIGISAAVLAMAMLAVQVMAPTVDVTANVNVPATCGLVVTGGSPIQFGNVYTGTESTPKQ